MTPTVYGDIAVCIVVAGASLLIVHAIDGVARGIAGLRQDMLRYLTRDGEGYLLRDISGATGQTVAQLRRMEEEALRMRREWMGRG